jgi:hypothetical protein
VTNGESIWYLQVEIKTPVLDGLAYVYGRLPLVLGQVLELEQGVPLRTLCHVLHDLAGVPEVAGAGRGHAHLVRERVSRRWGWFAWCCPVVAERRGGRSRCGGSNGSTSSTEDRAGAPGPVVPSRPDNAMQPSRGSQRPGWRVARHRPRPERSGWCCGRSAVLLLTERSAAAPVGDRTEICSPHVDRGGLVCRAQPTTLAIRAQGRGG